MLFTFHYRPEITVVSAVPMDATASSFKQVAHSRPPPPVPKVAPQRSSIPPVPRRPPPTPKASDVNKPAVAAKPTILPRPVITPKPTVNPDSIKIPEISSISQDQRNDLAVCSGLFPA